MLPDIRDHLLLTSEARSDAGRADLARRAARRELVRVNRGAYLPMGSWEALGDDDRIRVGLVAAAVVDGNDPLVSHGTAALMWGLPWLGPRPHLFDVLQQPGSRGHYSARFRRHAPGADDQWVRIDGIRVTSLCRTVADVARLPGFTRSVMVGDASLNAEAVAKLRLPAVALTPTRLVDEIASSPTDFAGPRARDVARFLDGASGSPGESASRVTMDRLRLPPPVLQRRFDHSGGSWFVDFWWPDHRVIGEFDGASKYHDAASRGGRTPAQVLSDEKLREDELRRRCDGFARWDFRVAVSPVRLAARLRSAGLPARVPRSSKRITAFELL